VITTFYFELETDNWKISVNEAGMADELTLDVQGMTCGGCENAVKRVVSMVDGVSNVTASHSQNKVTVTFDPSRTNRQAITRAIETAGYQVA
jgi:copper chaperone